MADNYLKEIKEKLLNAGYIVIENPDVENSLHYSDGIRIGCVSEDQLDFYHVSSVYKANRENGTGAVYAKGLTKSIADFENALTHSFSANVEWYKDLNEFLKEPVYGFGDKLDKIIITTPDRDIMTGEDFINMQNKNKQAFKIKR